MSSDLRSEISKKVPLQTHANIRGAAGTPRNSELRSVRSPLCLLAPEGQPVVELCRCRRRPMPDSTGPPFGKNVGVELINRVLNRSLSGQAIGAGQRDRKSGQVGSVASLAKLCFAPGEVEKRHDGVFQQADRAVIGYCESSSVGRADHSLLGGRNRGRGL